MFTNTGIFIRIIRIVLAKFRRNNSVAISSPRHRELSLNLLSSFHHSTWELCRTRETRERERESCNAQRDLNK